MTEPNSVYILITQCLQNNFFLAHENRLCLPSDPACRILVNNDLDFDPSQQYAMSAEYPNRRQIKPALLETGPLYRFFQSVIDSDAGQNNVHVVHIKDWHVPSESYDFERRTYGAHCEAGTWEAEPIDGFDKYLQPWKGLPAARRSAQSRDGYRDDKTTYYEVLSDSLFDFRPPDLHTKARLAQILDRLVYDDDGNMRRAYVVVIGVITDIKIKTLLTALRTNYRLENLVVSDVLTACPTMERHLSGLDYADKVLNVEIVHGLNDLVSILNPAHADTIPEAIIKYRPNFRHYRNYYQDKQNVLAYQDQKLVEYVQLTAQRGAAVYDQVFQTNRRLTWVGFIFLALTILLAIIRIFAPEKVTVDFIAITGGLSMVQLLTVFFNRPLGQLQQNLNNLVRLRNYLESYSTITALLRHHLTMPENLQSPDLPRLQDQMKLVQDTAERMSANFKDIQIGEKIPDEPSAPTP